MKVLHLIRLIPLWVAVASHLDAATITWSAGPYQNTGAADRDMGIDQFDQSGTPLMIVNLGGLAGTLVQSADPDMEFTASDPNLTISNMSGVGLPGTYHANRGGNNNISSSGSFTLVTEDPSSPGTITLSGLVIGQPYRIQALLMDGFDASSGRNTEFDGIDLGTFANGVFNLTWGDGLLATGTFTADAATQDFTIQAFDGATSLGGQLNALAVYALPVPTMLVEPEFQFENTDGNTSSHTVKIANTFGDGGTALTLTGVTATGEAATNIGNIVFPASIAPDANGDITFDFTPSYPGARTYSFALEISSNDASQPSPRIVGVTIKTQPFNNVLANGSFDGGWQLLSPTTTAVTFGETTDELTLPEWTVTSVTLPGLANGDTVDDPGPPFFVGNGSNIPYQLPSDGETFLFTRSNGTVVLEQGIDGLSGGAFTVAYDTNRMYAVGGGSLSTRVQVFDGSDDTGTLLFDEEIVQTQEPEETWITRGGPAPITHSGTELFVRVTLVDDAPSALIAIDRAILDYYPSASLPNPTMVVAQDLHFTNNDGSTSSQAVTVSNLAGDGTEHLSLTGVVAGGIDAGSVSNIGFPSTIAAGADSEITFDFTPSNGAGIYTFDLEITSDDGFLPTPRIISVKIEVLPSPALTVAASLSFKNNENLANYTIPISNSAKDGTTPLNLTDVLATGRDAPDVSNIQFPATLAAGTSGEITFDFNPTIGEGIYEFFIEIDSNDESEPSPRLIEVFIDVQSPSSGFADFVTDAGLDPATTGAPDVDADGDGVPTGIEWVVGGLPNDAASPDTGKLPTGIRVLADPDGGSTETEYLLFTFRRSAVANADPDTTINVRYGSDLAGWTTASDGINGVVMTETPDGFEPGIDRVDMFIPASLAVDGRLFGRLEVVFNGF